MATQPSGRLNNKIPPSQRIDGSLRKAIKIRPGFIPQEDLIAFVSHKVVKNSNFIPGSVPVEIKKESKIDSVQKIMIDRQEMVISLESLSEQKLKSEDPEIAKQKRIKSLSKKIRQIKNLESKTDLNEHQVEKLMTLNEIELELAQLLID